MSRGEFATATAGPTDRTGGSIDVTRGADGTYRVPYDPEDCDLTITITEALVAVGDVDPIDLVDDFSKYADPDALNRLFRRLPNGERRATGGRVHLAIEGYGVTIHSEGFVEIEP